MGRGERQLVFSLSAFIYSGVVPQQPPITDTPFLVSSVTSVLNSSGSTSNTVSPLRLLGRPAFGFKIMGREEYFKSFSTTPSSCFGPKEQLAPMASAPIPSKRATIASGEAPVISLPSSPYALETKTGRLQFSLAASKAAFVSKESFIVSIKTRSTPYFTPSLMV